ALGGKQLDQDRGRAGGRGLPGRGVRYAARFFVRGSGGPLRGMDHVAAASEEAEGWCKNQGNQDNKSTGPGCDKTYHGGSGNPALKSSALRKSDPLVLARSDPGQEQHWERWGTTTPHRTEKLLRTRYRCHARQTSDEGNPDPNSLCRNRSNES